MRTRVEETQVGLTGFPIGRRAVRGKKRWYLVHAPGREDATIRKLKKAISPDLLLDAFTIQKQWWKKIHGEWVCRLKPVFPDYFVIVTKDINELVRAFGVFTQTIDVAKADGRHYLPLAPEAQAWYESMMDARHVICDSSGVIVDGVLDVQKGPFVGREASIMKIVRTKRYCVVAVGDGGDGFQETMPLSIPHKS